MMTQVELMAKEEIESGKYSSCRFCHREDYEKELFIAGFNKAIEMAFNEAIQWPNNPDLETMKSILSLGKGKVNL